MGFLVERRIDSTFGQIVKEEREKKNFDVSGLSLLTTCPIIALHIQVSCLFHPLLVLYHLLYEHDSSVFQPLHCIPLIPNCIITRYPLALSCYNLNVFRELDSMLLYIFISLFLTIYILLNHYFLDFFVI